MGNFAENLNLGNRFRPPLNQRSFSNTPSSENMTTEKLIFPSGCNLKGSYKHPIISRQGYHAY